LVWHSFAALAVRNNILVDFHVSDGGGGLIDVWYISTMQ
jgi:hypothetical protein